MVFSFFIAWLRQAQPPCYSRCLSLSKAEVIFCSSGDFDKLNHRVTFGAWAYRRQILIPPGDFDKLNHRVTFGAWACRRQVLTHHPVISTSSITVLLSVPEPVEGTFSLILPVISAPLNQRVTPGAWACRRHILIPLPCDFDKLNHRVIFTTTLGAWACRRHIFQSLSV